MIEELLDAIFPSVPTIVALSRKYQSQSALTYLSQLQGFDTGLLRTLEETLNQETDKNGHTGKAIAMFAGMEATEEDPPNHLCCPISMVCLEFDLGLV